jgi:oligopeptidase A
MNNPLLDLDHLPAFDAIRPEHVEPAIDEQLAQNRALIATLTAMEPAPADASARQLFEQLVLPLERARQRLGRVWSPVTHLNAVMNNEPLREAYNACLSKLTGYATEVSQNEALCEAYKAILARDDEDGLDPAQRKLLEDAVRDFRLAGVDLPAAAKARFAEVRNELSAAQSRFEENVLDATTAWSRHITDRAELDGLPEHMLARAAAEAAERGLDGWVLTLDFPTYQAVVTHAESADLRRTLYEAWATRASDRGPHAGEWDNTGEMSRILSLRQEIASITGFANYAEYSLATKMAASVDEVIAFLEELADRSRPAGEAEMATLEAFAGRALEAWDVPWVAEQVRRRQFDISDEMLRPYFPLDRVVAGLFRLVETLFAVRVRRDEQVAGWHPDTRFYVIEDADGTARGGFYVDLFARARKRGGAWMDECVVRAELDERTELPVAYLVCNFTPASGGRPAQLSHAEVVTLFHEFGHSLHHMLTRVGYPSLAGINGVPWDAVELPSQFLENFAWTPEVIGMISGHVDTGEPLPDAMLRKLIDSRGFNAGMQMLRQLEFALFDMRLHAAGDGQAPNAAFIMRTLDEVRQQVSVVPVPEFNRFACSFSHIFAGGYAAGYYSYKWAEVLSADAFSAFEEEGILSQQTGERWLRNVLEVGGTREAMDAFVAFRGRRPTVDALLRHNGLLSTETAQD